jgi:hypothetical protein
MYDYRWLNGEIKLTRRERVRKLRDDDLMVRTRRCGKCGNDKRITKFPNPVPPSWHDKKKTCRECGIEKSIKDFPDHRQFADSGVDPFALPMGLTGPLCASCQIKDNKKFWRSRHAADAAMEIKCARDEFFRRINHCEIKYTIRTGEELMARLEHDYQKEFMDPCQKYIVMQYDSILSMRDWMLHVRVHGLFKQLMADVQLPLP